MRPPSAEAGPEALDQPVGAASRISIPRCVKTGHECADFVVEPGRIQVRGLTVSSPATAVLTSASGDLLYVSHNEAGNPPNLAGDVHLAGLFTITGGTGRLAGASGNGTITADVNITRPDVTVDMTGTISTSD